MPNKELKNTPKGRAGNGVRSLPTDVRNNMGYKMNDGVYKMAQIAGKPVMPMNPSDKLYATDPIKKSIRPLYATPNNLDKFTETSKSGNIITYDTTTDGRPVIYPVGMDVPANIRQRSSNSARDMQFAKSSYQSIMKSDDAKGFGNQVMTSIGQSYTGANRAIGDFKRQTINMPREYQSNYSNIDINSSASMLNPRTGKQISFGSPYDVSNYQYDTEYSKGMTNMLGGPDAKYPTRKNTRIFNQSEKVQSNIDSAVKSWRSGEKSGLKNLEQGLVHVQPEKPKVEIRQVVDMNAKPKKDKKKKGPGLFKVIGTAISDLNLFRPARYKGARIKSKGKSRSGSSFRYRGGRGGGRRSNRFTRG